MQVDLAVVGRAIGMFAVTNVDDIVVLALFFSQAPGRAGALRVVLGQYLGFAAILIVSVAVTVGTGLLPESYVAYLGLLPVALGLRAGWRAWSEREDRDAPGLAGRPALGVLSVATVTFANGGDNIGVYVPVFATTDAAGLVTYCAVFLLMVAVWCALGLFFATRPLVASTLSRWGHLVLPLVLVGIGLVILIEGGAFGL